MFGRQLEYKSVARYQGFLPGHHPFGKVLVGYHITRRIRRDYWMKVHFYEFHKNKSEIIVGNR